MPKKNATLNNAAELLNSFESTRFVESASYSQRLAARPFYSAITLYAFDRTENPLPSESVLAAARQALAEHRASSRVKEVNAIARTASAREWLRRLQNEALEISEALHRNDVEAIEVAETVESSGEPKPAEPAFAAHSAGLAPELDAPSSQSEAGPAEVPTVGAPAQTLAVGAAPEIEALKSQSGAGSEEVPTVGAPQPLVVDRAPEIGSPTPQSAAGLATAPTVDARDQTLVECDAVVDIGETAAATRSLAEWVKPVDLAEAYGPDFPVHALSSWHQRFVSELAEQVQIAVDVPALASLAMIGAAVAKTVVIEIQPGDVQPTNFWTLIVSPPGDGKTPLLGELRRPFDQAQATMRDAERAEAARVDTEVRIARITLQRLEREAAACDDDAEKDDLTGRAVELRKRLDQRRVGVPTLSTGDCTQLGLISLMANNKGRLLLLTDEGDQLFSRVQQRSPRGAEDIDDMLKAYSGATVDRHDARCELRVPGAALSIVATTQPRPWAKVMGIEAYHSKGFLGRFALALPRSTQGLRKQRRAGVSEEARSAYQTLLRELLERPVPDVPTALTLSEEAFQAFATCGEEADREIVRNRDASFGAWLGKLRGLTARLAGILHVSDPFNRDLHVISVETMTRAVEVARYLLAHARVAYEHSERAAQDDDPRRLLRWVRDGRRLQFTHAEAVASFSGRLNAREVETCLERLVVAGYLRERPPLKSRGGRPRKASYQVSPWVFRGR